MPKFKYAGKTIVASTMKEAVSKLSKLHSKVVAAKGNIEEPNTTDEMWDFLLKFDIATEDEIRLVININGDNKQTYLDILYARTGYRDFQQYIDEYVD